VKVLETFPTISPRASALNPQSLRKRGRRDAGLSQNFFFAVEYEGQNRNETSSKVYSRDYDDSALEEYELVASRPKLGDMKVRLGSDQSTSENDFSASTTGNSIVTRYNSTALPEIEASENNGVQNVGSEFFHFANGGESGQAATIRSKDTTENEDDGTTLLERSENSTFIAQISTPMGRLYSSITNKTEEAPVNATVLTESPATEEFRPSGTMPIKRLWRRRHARTLEEGIRRERTEESQRRETAADLSILLGRAQIDARKTQNRRYVERTMMGLINALAEEIEDLDVDIDAIPNTPLWRKEVKEIRISFSRLGFKPLRIGGSDMSKLSQVAMEEDDTESETELSLVECADEAFDRIDVDNSGTLDRAEIAQALSMISELETDKESVEDLASQLIDLYDINSDGVVDREEYQQMVEDMAELQKNAQKDDSEQKAGPISAVKKSVKSVSQGISKKAAEVAAAVKGSSSTEGDFEWEPEMGSIVLSNLSLDLRQLIFGNIPLLKRITPGGHLILQPFTATVRGSFSREDVMGSFLLDAGLRLLVARALRVRLRSFRDFTDGALFFGRRWKMRSRAAPVVEVLGLSNVEFDRRDRMIVTGRARIRTGPDAPIVTNTFKVRTNIGTTNNGQNIRLVEPELAFVFECPKAWENGLGFVCEKLGLPPPQRPEPYYSFFPIYSPFKVNENAGYNMGDDNRIREIFIKNGRLCIEMRSILRPGRFLGNHYLAFTVPQRSLIITMDRIRQGVRAARKNKKIAVRQKKLSAEAAEAEGLTKSPKPSNPDEGEKESTTSPRRGFFRFKFKKSSFSLKNKQPKPKSFFSRFVEGYTLVEREGEAKNERLTNEISDWFGRQGSSGNANRPRREE